MAWIQLIRSWRGAALIGCVLAATACASPRTAACVRITPTEPEPLVVQETAAVVLGLAQSRLDPGSGRMPGRIEFEETPLEDVLKYLQLEVPWVMRIHKSIALSASVNLRQGRELELNTIAEVLDFVCESVSLRWLPGPNCIFIESLTGGTDDIDLTLTYSLTDEGELDRAFRIYLDKELQRAFLEHGVHPTKLEFSDGRMVVVARPACQLIVRQVVASCLALRNATAATHRAASSGDIVSTPDGRLPSRA
ncbi:MAG: hypothetical protein IT461_17715 [Planctomycetes bacterium]|jgi:hypothetical protein|nr:hypothetical protein [Planctomycetota bacterium]